MSGNQVSNKVRSIGKHFIIHQKIMYLKTRFNIWVLLFWFDRSVAIKAL